VVLTTKKENNTMTINTPVIAGVSPGEQVLDLGSPAQAFRAGMVQRADDPVIDPAYALPADFAAQYPMPLDPTEIVAMCEEVTAYQAIPELFTSLKYDLWRELNELAFASGSSYIAFADGECPEEYAHDGDNTTVTLKNIGAKKALAISDIMHSAAVAAANWHGINRLVGGIPSSGGLPGGSNMTTFTMENVADLKAKEVRLAMTLVLNGWDRLLILGDATTNALEFDGIELLVTNANGAHISTASASGSISAISFDQFLSESCAKPTHIWGHPQAVQELLSAYFQLGYQGSQIVNFSTGNRITPGFNFAGFLNTGVGRLAVVADNNFTRTASGSTTFQSDLFALRMTHNGEPLVYKRTQIPLALRDLTPGCTAIQFEIWAKTALIIKHMCAHGRYTSLFTGQVTTTCPVIG
jgi:hypothetical protein